MGVTETDMVDEIDRAWKEFQSLPFPESVLDDDGRGADLTSLDSFAAGCIDTFIENNGKLDTERIDILKRIRIEISNATSGLNDDALAYFQKLSSIIEKVLEHLRKGS